MFYDFIPHSLGYILGRTFGIELAQEAEHGVNITHFVVTGYWTRVRSFGLGFSHIGHTDRYVCTYHGILNWPRLASWNSFLSHLGWRITGAENIIY